MYYIYCLHTKRTTTKGLTIQQAYNELKHSGGFGIANELTNLPILRKPMDTFRLPVRLQSKDKGQFNKYHRFQ